MNPIGCYAAQQRIKIIEVYFATKSVLLTQWQYRINFCRSNVPNRKTIQSLVTKFWEIGSVAESTKATVVGIAPAKISSALPLCQKNWFCGKVRLVNFYFLRPVGSILVSKESPRPAVCTTWKIWKKIVKHDFGMKNKIGRFFWTTL